MHRIWRRHFSELAYRRNPLTVVFASMYVACGAMLALAVTFLSLAPDLRMVLYVLAALMGLCGGLMFVAFADVCVYKETGSIVVRGRVRLSEDSFDCLKQYVENGQDFPKCRFEHDAGSLCSLFYLISYDKRFLAFQLARRGALHERSSAVGVFKVLTGEAATYAVSKLHLQISD